MTDSRLGSANRLALTASAYLETLFDTMRRIEATDRTARLMNLDVAAQQAVDVLADVRQRGRKALVIGNGGSAAIATHLHNDLCKSAGIRAMVFTDVPLLTALANDHGYGTAFQWAVNLWADSEDVLLAISSSGRSASILSAVDAAASRGCRIITFSGFAADNPLRTRGDVNFYVPSAAYGYVEMAHAALAHCLSDCSAGAGGAALA